MHLLRRLILCLCFVLTHVLAFAQVLPPDTLGQRTKVRLETTCGNITIELFNETPIHRDNFIKLVNEQFYDSLLFHRTIHQFVIQTGDPKSRTCERGTELGETDSGYMLPAEIRYPELAHFRGAVAAARESDDKNPERKSSGSQFYIVWGKHFGKGMMERARRMVQSQTSPEVTIPEVYDSLYWERGGTPTLDAQYTVFGQVVEGMNVVNEIQMAETDDNDRPLYEYRILRAYVLRDER